MKTSLLFLCFLPLTLFSQTDTLDYGAFRDQLIGQVGVGDHYHNSSDGFTIVVSVPEQIPETGISLEVKVHHPSEGWFALYYYHQGSYSPDFESSDSPGYFAKAEDDPVLVTMIANLQTDLIRVFKE